MEVFSILRSSVFQILSILFLFGYLLGVLNVYFSDNNNYCVMTYMYEYPQSVRISIPENKDYPQYGLYAYSEGRLTERARKMWFDGIPVLFLPGNFGSHMQVRSLASVALRKALSDGYDYHFDYFTISINEELSALYGGVLQSQTRFAAASISRILSLYKSNKYTKSVPTSVILIGHSMGGLIAKRLLAYPSTINTTNIAIALAAPLTAPVVNFDVAVNDYYMLMDYEWEINVRNNEEYRDKKMLISFGNGPRDILVPSGLTYSNDSYINALTTAVPGVWVSPDHVSIVWCKQLVMAINRFLFSLVDYNTEQIIDDQAVVKARARQYFQANRSMELNPSIPRANSTMIADAFWYEDNRRIYQVSRPEIDKTTYLMIRLVKFPQNRFVAVEAVNVDDSEWVFGCNAQFTHHMHRYCKSATTLTELSRWTGVANDFGKRKLATINLHKLMNSNPDWTHVIVKVSPTRKPITLNVDINDHASRQIPVELSDYTLSKTTIIPQTEPDSLYYELVLKNFDVIHQAYLLYVEPVQCKGTSFHASAEIHVPWAENHESYHYFTHLKQSPMKLRLFKSNPDVISGKDTTQYVKVTLLLDPQCTFTVSISPSWYYRLAQLARHYSPALVPYVAGAALLVARGNMLRLRAARACVSVPAACRALTPYYVLVLARLLTVGLTSTSTVSFIFENASWQNPELQHFTRSLLVLPAYMTAVGILVISVAVILGVMVFSSQIAHRMLFKLLWRGGPGLADKLASGLQKVPAAVSVALVMTAPLACGAASLALGAAFYAFMLSKMYEEYLEDYFFKILAKVASRACKFFKKKDRIQNRPETNAAGEKIQWTNLEELEQERFVEEKEKCGGDKEKSVVDNKKSGDDNKKSGDDIENSVDDNKESGDEKENSDDEEQDDDLSNLNFHMTMFLLWLSVTLLNIPALLIWAKNFKYSTTLKPDSSYHVGLIMSACSTYIWQMEGPRKNLRYYDAVSSLIFTMAVFILALGPFSLTIVNYGTAFMFLVITAQQILDKSDEIQPSSQELIPIDSKEADQKTDSKEQDDEKMQSGDTNASSESQNEDCECSESRIFTMFKNLRDKFDFTDNL